MRANRHKLKQGKLMCDEREIFFLTSAVRQRNGMPRKTTVQSPSLEAFKFHQNKALSNVILSQLNLL